MAKNLRQITCLATKACRKCGSPVAKASIQGHYVCLGNNCDSGIVSLYRNCIKATFSQLTRKENIPVAFNVGTARSGDVLDCKITSTQPNHRETVWYSDEHLLPLIGDVPNSNVLLGNNGKSVGKSLLHYIQGTDRHIYLYELPMFQCGLEVKVRDKIKTWAEICSETHFEEDDTWVFKKSFARPEKFLDPATIEKILTARFEGLRVFHTQPEVTNPPETEKKSSRTSKARRKAGLIQLGTVDPQKKLI